MKVTTVCPTVDVVQQVWEEGGNKDYEWEPLRRLWTRHVSRISKNLRKHTYR